MEAWERNGEGGNYGEMGRVEITEKWGGWKLRRNGEGGNYGEMGRVEITEKWGGWKLRRNGEGGNYGEMGRVEITTEGLLSFSFGKKKKGNDTLIKRQGMMLVRVKPRRSQLINFTT